MKTDLEFRGAHACAMSPTTAGKELKAATTMARLSFSTSATGTLCILHQERGSACSLWPQEPLSTFRRQPSLMYVNYEQEQERQTTPAAATAADGLQATRVKSACNHLPGPSTHLFSLSSPPSPRQHSPYSKHLVGCNNSEDPTCLARRSHKCAERVARAIRRRGKGPSLRPPCCVAPPATRSTCVSANHSASECLFLAGDGQSHPACSLTLTARLTVRLRLV